MRIFLTIAMTLVFNFYASAQQSDEEMVKALEQTQQDLRDKSSREKILNSRPAAKQQDDKVNQVVQGNNQTKDQIYDLSADLLAVLMTQAGNDPNKLQAMLIKFQADPAAFIKMMPEAQRKKFESVVRQIETDRGIASPKSP